MDTTGDISLDKIQALLRAKDDTQRFVGLAFLKSILDNSPTLRRDPAAVRELWSNVSPRFLDRLLRTGSNPQKAHSKDMLDLAVSILHTFAVLLPEASIRAPSLTGRIPALVDAVLHSSKASTELVLKTLYTLVSFEDGASVLIRKDDLSPLIEVAPSYPEVLDILRYAVLNSMANIEDKPSYLQQIEDILQALSVSFTGTDAVTLLQFLGDLFRQTSPQIVPQSPKWLPNTVRYIQKLVVSRPTPQGRASYTNAAASLLQSYPHLFPPLLFAPDRAAEKPFSYLFINLLLIDIRASAPLLLEQLNTPAYAGTSRRLASAFDVISIFTGYLVRCLEDESMDALIMSPDNLLRLRKGISETMSIAIEYLRDRWDASVAGAMGLHPDARAGKSNTSTGSHHTLTWDSAKHSPDADPLVLAAVRSLALWLREDENDLLRKEATGLTDMFLELYHQADSPERLEFKSPVLVALEATSTLDKGRRVFLDCQGWACLSKDLTGILLSSPSTIHDAQASRGVEIIRILINIAEQHPTATEEDWMDLVTTAAGRSIAEHGSSNAVLELEVAVLQLSCSLLARTKPGMRRRYRHSTEAIGRMARQLNQLIGDSSVLKESMEDVVSTLDDVNMEEA